MNELKLNQFVGTGQTNNRTGQVQPNQKELATITGILTSRIETKKDYYYGFFKLANQNQEIPVIFKGGKPPLAQSTKVELAGT
jgi:hypothetical protein